MSVQNTINKQTNKQTTNFKDIYIQKGTVYLRPQIAKANRGGRSYTQSVVKPVIIKLQQYNNIRSVKYDNVKLKE